MGFFDFFKKKKTIIEEIEDITIKAYRTIGEYNGTPPTNKTSDKDIIRISTFAHKT